MKPSELPLFRRHLCKNGGKDTSWSSIFVIEKLEVSGSGLYAIFKVTSGEANGALQSHTQWRNLDEVDEKWTVLESLHPDDRKAVAA